MRFLHVFDLGNVLIFVDEPLFLCRVRARCRPGAPVAQVLALALEQSRIDVGGDFDSIHPLLVRDLGLSMARQELRLAWNDIFTPIPRMLEVVRESPRPRYLLSTTNHPHVAWLRQHYGRLFDLFDHCFLTCEIGLRKPDVRLFRHVESVTGEPAERHLFVDDLPQNVAGAHAAGWHAFQFLGVGDCRCRLAQLAAPQNPAGAGAEMLAMKLTYTRHTSVT